MSSKTKTSSVSITLTSKRKVLSAEQQFFLESSLILFETYKKKEAALKALEENAKAARNHIVDTLRLLDPSIEGSNDYSIVLEGNKTFLVTSKATKESFLSVEDIEADITKLQEKKARLLAKEKIVKSAPKVTFRVTEVVDLKK